MSGERREAESQMIGSRMEKTGQIRAGKKPDLEEQVLQAATCLQGGGVVGYPSETVWGLAARPERGAVDRLYQLKGRETDKPVQLSCLTVEHARQWLQPAQPEIDRLAHFWPGPLTLLAWATADCPEWLAPGGVVGLRVPSHPVIRALLAATGGTLATTSLNPTGHPAAATFGQAEGYGLADLLLSDLSPESGQTPPDLESSGLASTVFDLRTRQVLRQGDISQAELLAALR